MPTAATLIERDGTGSQLKAESQIWVVVSSSGGLINLKFGKAFVKKHLFADPDPPAVMQDKADKLVGLINTISHSKAHEAAPTTPLSMDTLRFLKLKKLVWARFVEGVCAVCHKMDNAHALVCSNCDHFHVKVHPTRVFPCDAPMGGVKCPCTTNNPVRKGLKADAATCPQFVIIDEYGTHRGAAKGNPFTGTLNKSGENTVILMSKVDLQAFKDAVVAAITGAGAVGTAGTPIDLMFGKDTVVTIKNTDTLDLFNARATGRGMRVNVHMEGAAYVIDHYSAMVA